MIAILEAELSRLVLSARYKWECPEKAELSAGTWISSRLRDSWGLNYMGFASFTEDIVERACEDISRIRDRLERDARPWFQPLSQVAKNPKSVRSAVKWRNRYQKDATKLQKVIGRCQTVLDKLLEKLTDPKLKELDVLKLKEQRDAAVSRIKLLEKAAAVSEKSHERRVAELENELSVFQNHCQREIATRDSELREARKSGANQHKEINSLKQKLMAVEKGARHLQDGLTDVQNRLVESTTVNRSLRQEIATLSESLADRTWRLAVTGVTPLRSR